MKSLIIHPEDNSTTFLKPIYKQASNKSVICRSTTPEAIAEGIQTSNRVMIMGHGSPQGLFSMGLFRGIKQIGHWLAIGMKESESLKSSDQNIYIWCNADKYVEYHDLHGFYSGMFISEVGEAMYCGVSNATQEMVDESNNTFAEIVGKYINLPVTELHKKVKQEYGELAKTNSVAKFNCDRIYVR